MEVSFGANQTAAADVTPATDNASPATPPTPEPPPQNPPAGSQLPARHEGIVMGDWIPDFKEMIVPRVNIVQNIGQLKDSFEPGELTYDQRVVLFTPQRIVEKTGEVKQKASPPVIITVLGFRKPRFVEKVVGGTKGMIVDTEDAVRAAGGTLDYGEWNLKKAMGMKRFEPLADALVAIQRPEAVEDDDTVFGYEVEGAKYTIGMWSFKGTTYTAACKRVFFPHRNIGILKVVRDKAGNYVSGGYPTWSYSCVCREEKWQNGNCSWLPIFVPHKKNTAAFWEFARSIIG